MHLVLQPLGKAAQMQCNALLGWRVAEDAAISAPPQTVGSLQPVPSLAFVLLDKNHSTNSADTHHVLYCIIIFMRILSTIL